MQSLESSKNFQSIVGLNQYWLILKRRRLPALFVFILVFAATTLTMVLRKPIYLAEGNLLIKKLSSTPFLTQVGEGVGQLQPLNEVRSSPLDTEAEILLSVPMIQKTIATLALTDEKGIPITREEFLRKLKVSRLNSADLLEVSYEDSDPKKAAEVVNTLMNLYLENNISANRSEAKSARDFLEQQLPQAQARVNQEEMALRKFKEENNLVTPIEQQASSAETILADLDQKIIQIRSEYADINNHINALRNNLNSNSNEAVAINSLNQSFLRQSSSSQYAEEQALLARLEELESQLAIQRTRFTSINPMLALLESQIEAIKKQLLGKLEARRKNLANQIDTLSQEQSSYKQRLMILPALEQQQRELERQLQASQANYSKLLENLEAVRLAENQKIANAHIVSPAIVPEKPVAPRKSLSVLTGLLLGSLVSIATISLLETRDKSIKTVEEARGLLGFPLLGVIPLMGKSVKASLPPDNLEDFNQAITVRDYPLIPFSESYRMLQTNLKFLRSDNTIKVIVVTSSIPQEGKSTVTANLALSMAQRGQKVLLVDADLRRPQQHHVSNLSNQMGLSNVLVREIEYQAAIKQVTNNLDVLTGGIAPPNPIALLDSQTMTSLVEQFSADYDFVIIDTPPLMAASEALVLGKMADGVVLVVRPGLIDSVGVNIAKERLEQSGQNVLGIVVNGIISDNEPHSDYYSPEKYYQAI
ncbi:polysaccharide biosynthesis tyrosine autokinase [Pleurocapsales cyanobacterium LEGE 06147]|nr:polysaccharide biosynthesis tyrosine autokinase [Pleurocapsales cyanobacterium LEGE 06147]